MLILDDSSPDALGVDLHIPPSAAKVSEAIAGVWPRLRGRVQFQERPLQSVELAPSDVVVSAHACGGLTDRVLERAAGAPARVAVLPCCHRLAPERVNALEGWVDAPLAMDIERAVRLWARGFKVFTKEIPARITPKNRLLLGEPLRASVLVPELPHEPSTPDADTGIIY